MFTKNCGYVYNTNQKDAVDDDDNDNEMVTRPSEKYGPFNNHIIVIYSYIHIHVLR